MPDLLARLLPWAIGVVVLAVAIVAVVIAVRAGRRGRRARAAALAERNRAAASLLRLDDALADLDLDLALSGAREDPAAPASVRRARMTAQHARDDAYAELRAAADPGLLPVDIRAAARQVEDSTAAALDSVTTARREHDTWVRAAIEPAAVLAAARRRLAETRETLGDPAALLRDLSRFDKSEWADAATAATAVAASIAAADARLDEAERFVAQGSGKARPALEAAERALRQAVADDRTLEEMHRLVIEAARAVPGELAAARAAVAEVREARRALRPAEAVRLDGEVGVATASLDALQADAARRPTATVRRVAEVRARLDAAAGAALTPQQRVRSARTALPGTIASARASIVRLEALLRTGGDPRTRMLLAEAQHDLSIARGADDALQALDVARSSVRDADRAIALSTAGRMAEA